MKEKVMKGRKERLISIIENIGNRTPRASKSQKVKKSNNFFDLIGQSHKFFQRWIFYQLYCETDLQKYGTIYCTDHCYPLSKTNLTNENEMYKSTSWVNSRPMFCSENISRGIKNENNQNLPQQIKAKYFAKIKQEGFNKFLYWGDIQHST